MVDQGAPEVRMANAPPMKYLPQFGGPLGLAFRFGSRARLFLGLQLPPRLRLGSHVSEKEKKNKNKNKKR